MFCMCGGTPVKLKSSGRASALLRKWMMVDGQAGGTKRTGRERSSEKRDMLNMSWRPVNLGWREKSSSCVDAVRPSRIRLLIKSGSASAQ